VKLAVPAKPVPEPKPAAKKPVPVAKEAEAKPAAPAKPAPVEKATPEPTQEPRNAREAEPEAASEAKVAAKPAPEEARAGSAAESGEPASTAPADAYAAAASRWRDRVRGDGSAPGPIGTGGGSGGGGTVVGLAFLAYRQQVIERIKEHWSTAVRRPGLLSRVQFQIAPNGAVANVRLAHSSGDRVYDETAVRAVQSVERLPPPPPEYVDAFREFMIEFHADEVGGGSG
jgi:TolA protein